MAISETDIAQVRSATDIVALISEYAALKKVGRRWSGLCPFHAEKTPSFSVNAEEGFYYCFGCRASGDAITFLREVQHLDFVDAVRQLADRAGIELHEDAAAGPARKERQALLDAMDRAVAWYHERLLEAPDARAARDYLRSRGIGGELARRFRLGWAPDDWDALSRALDLPESVMTGTGLGFVNRRGRRQDSLRARVIFPILDPSGKPIAVGGRVLPGREPGPDGYVEPKYKNSPETPIYSKRRTLYALNWAKEGVIKAGEIVVCEGYTDVIAMFAAGVERAVATCGTALGEDHFKTMRNFARKIVLAYDADAAGQSAAASVYQWERQYEVDVAVARLPAGADPADLAQRDPAALRAAVEGAVPFLGFRLERALASANLSTAEGRARAGEAALAVLAEHPSELVRDQYVMEVADRLRLDSAALRARLAGWVRVGHAPEPARRSRDDQEPSQPRPGVEALRLRIHRPESVAGRLVAPMLVNETQREIFEALESGQPVAVVVDVLRHRGDDAAALSLARLVVDDVDDDAVSVSAVVAQLLRAAAQAELAELDRELREGVVAPDVAVAIVRDVKERVDLLEGDRGEAAETDLRDWLLERAGAARP